MEVVGVSGPEPGLCAVHLFPAPLRPLPPTPPPRASHRLRAPGRQPVPGQRAPLATAARRTAPRPAVVDPRRRAAARLPVRRAPSCQRFRGAGACGKGRAVKQAFYGFRLNAQLCCPACLRACARLVKPFAAPVDPSLLRRAVWHAGSMYLLRRQVRTFHRLAAAKPRKFGTSRVTALYCAGEADTTSSIAPASRISVDCPRGAFALSCPVTVSREHTATLRRKA